MVTIRSRRDTSMILQATHSHLYPGHRGTVSELDRVADLKSEVDCLIEFSDGSATLARVARTGNDWRLDTGAYRTSAGTRIAEKQWLVRLEDSDGQVNFRILGKAHGG